MHVGDIGVRGRECEAYVCMYVCWVYRGYEVCVYICIHSVCVRGGEMCEVCVCMLSVQGYGVYIVCCGLCASTTVHRMCCVHLQ